MSFLLSEGIILYFTRPRRFRLYFPFSRRSETGPSWDSFDFYGPIADNTPSRPNGGSLRRTIIALALVLSAVPAAPAGVRLSLTGGYAAALEANDAGGWGASAAGEFDLGRALAVGLRLTRIAVSIQGTEGFLSQGQVSVLPIEIFLQLRWPGSGRLRPYLEAGGGYSFNSAALAPAVAEAWDLVGFTASESVKGSPAFFAGAGCDFALGSRLFLSAHVQAMIAKADGSWSLTDTATGLKLAGDIQDQSLNAIYAGLGLKYLF
jgi:hypothetical protein